MCYRLHAAITGCFKLVLIAHMWYNVAMIADHPALPSTDILAIEQSEHKIEIFGLLCSGVSPARTVTLMQQRYGAALDVEDVQAYAEQIPKEYFLEPGELQKRANYVDVEVDAIGEMASILRFMKDEVTVAILATKLTSGDGTVTADTHKLVARYWTMLRKFEELRGELGLVPVASKPETTLPSTETLPSLRDLVLQQNLILPPGTTIKKPKLEFIDAEVRVLENGASKEGS